MFPELGMFDNSLGMFSLELNPLPYPSLNLDFTTGTLDSRITFTRTQGTTTAATYYNSSGVLSYAAANTPRFDYDTVALTPKGLLIEETRTNLLTYSSAFDNVAWTKLNTSVTGDTTTAPDGTTTADTFKASAGSAMHFLFPAAPTVSVGVQITCSIYAKAGTYNLLQLTTLNEANVYANFDLTAGTVGTRGSNVSSATITNVGSGWYRCNMVITSTTDPAGARLVAAFSNSTSATRLPTWTAAGTETIILWGAQVEAGAFATSYIPTTSTTVQRGADNASMTGTNFSSWFNQSQGTVLVDATTSNVAYGPNLVAISDGTIDNRMFFTLYSPYQARITAGTVLQATLNSSIPVALASTKMALSYIASNSLLSVNAAAPASSGAISIPTVSGLYFGSNGSSAPASAGQTWTKRLTYYRTALTAAQIKGLTT